MANFKKIINFLFETNYLKRVPRSGYQVLGVKNESVAEHLFHTSIIGWVLAKLEGADEEKVIKMCLLSDIHETRISDLNWIAMQYFGSETKKDVSKKAEGDIFFNLPFEQEAHKLIDNLNNFKSKEAKIVKDADTLAFLVQLKEFIDKGDEHAREWFEFAKDRLQCKSAKALMKQLEKTDMQDWWSELKIKNKLRRVK